MKQQQITNLNELLANSTLEQLKNLVATREQMTKLETQKDELQHSLDKVNSQLTTLLQNQNEALQGPTKQRTTPEPKKFTIPELVAQILKESDRPLRLAEIADRIIHEKHYQSKSKDFKNQRLCCSTGTTKTGSQR